MKKLTVEQKALLQLAVEGKIPDSPCGKCQVGMGCCGCDEYTDYKKEMKDYEDNGIMDIAIQLKRAYNLKKKAEELNSESFNILKKYVDVL